MAASPYVPPHPLPPGASYVRTRVLSSGDLRVTHWIASRAPVGSVRLARPTLAGLPPLSVSRVVVVGDGVPAVHDSPAPYAYNLGGARALYVSYVLQGVLTHAPQQHDRALALVTNLRVTGLPRLTTVMHAVVGRHILNLACSPATPDAVATPCGASGGHGWRVTLLGPAVDERVMAQLDLAGSTQP